MGTWPIQGKAGKVQDKPRTLCCARKQESSARNVVLSNRYREMISKVYQMTKSGQFEDQNNEIYRIYPTESNKT